MKKNYLGSVRFFKHLYIVFFVVLFFIPFFFSLYFWQIKSAVSKEINTPTEANAQTQSESEKTPTDLNKMPYSENVPEYQKKYPELVIASVKQKHIVDNTVYLTFDDGPSAMTEKILDILKKNQIKATFFIIGKHLHTSEAQETLKRIVREGHSLGIHTDSHNYRKIYASVDAYLDDFARVEKKIVEITGTKPVIFRFPGGSINTYNARIYPELIAEMTRRGYVYFDWNISSGDSLEKKPENIVKNVIHNAEQIKRAIVLMHDNADKINTLKALPKMIESFQAKEVKFDKLTNEMYSVKFGYRY